MNPFAQNHYDQIKVLMKALSRDFQEYEKRLARAEKAKEQKVKECWAATSQAHAFKETLESMPVLEEENKRLRKENREALARARRILEYAKTLAGGIQP